MISSTLIGL